MATLRQLLAYVRDTLIPLIDGGSDYTHDLTATGAARLAEVPAAGPEMSPSLYVWLDRSKSSHAGPASFRGYRREVVIKFAGFVIPSSTDGDTPYGRVTAAADLQDDLEMAILKSARFDTGSTKLAQSVSIEATAIDGAEVNSPAYGVCYGQIRITAIREQ